jgi:hypothetical protein
MPDSVKEKQIFPALQDEKVDQYITYAGLHPMCKELMNIPEEILGSLKYFGVENYQIKYSFPNGIQVSLINGQMFNIFNSEQRNLFEMAIFVEDSMAEPFAYLKPEQVKKALNILVDLKPGIKLEDANNALIEEFDSHSA